MTASPAQPLRMAEELDPDGVPKSLGVGEWLDLAGADNALDPRITRWLLAVLRFSRADGSPFFATPARRPDRLLALQGWVDRSGDPSLSAVLARWRRPTGNSLSPLPSPSDSRPDRTLAVLRPDWDTRGDRVAIDHRQAGDTTLVEVGARGRTWIGPTWTSGSGDGEYTRSRPARWTHGTFAHRVEWSHEGGSGRVNRVAVLLPGRSMALLGQEVEGTSPVNEVRLALGEGIEVARPRGSNALVLSAGRGRPTARLIPLGLPAEGRSRARGSVEVEGREVVIRQAVEGKRDWLPVLLAWGKAPSAWRSLTVSQRLRTSRDDSATAVHVAFGRFDEGLVVYRSLAAPALRCFLGHQTASRFLVGSFSRSGEVRPILQADA